MAKLVPLQPGAAPDTAPATCARFSRRRPATTQTCSGLLRRRRCRSPWVHSLRKSAARAHHACICWPRRPSRWCSGHAAADRRACRVFWRRLHARDLATGAAIHLVRRLLVVGTSQAYEPPPAVPSARNSPTPALAKVARPCCQHLSGRAGGGRQPGAAHQPGTGAADAPSSVSRSPMHPLGCWCSCPRGAWTRRRRAMSAGPAAQHARAAVGAGRAVNRPGDSDGALASLACCSSAPTRAG